MTKTLGSLILDEITLTVPLSTDADDTRTIDVFARIVTRSGGENLPYLVFLQGGPGNEAPRPSLSPLNPNWLGVALEEYRVVMLDQRGTGLSTPVNDDILNKPAEDVAEYLTHLRADGIVRDAEAVRKHLGVEKWNLLGQSFGGFTTLHYLSRHADSLDTVYFTGGLSAIDRPAEDVYINCYNRMRRNSEEFYRRFPQLRDTFGNLVELARAGEIVLPTGEVVSETRLRSLGHLLGSNDGWFDLYSLLERDPKSNAFLHDLAGLLPFGNRNPLYYVLHESSYADGVVTNWAAERVLPDDFREDPTLLTGEHVFQEWMDTVPSLKPWKDVALILAQNEWPKLYDAQALQNSNAKGAAAVYANDVFVPLDYSLETAAHMPGVQLFITSQHEHNGLRSSAGAVLKHLFDLAHGREVR
ncbi:aminopeptidase [Corynebacterium deserti GIMN1.010]|uniref:Aminopeptidase n=1 Tax=Corynebacterium deserti GIMN1.010 TaxID=931089 RepID=A0A0M4CEM9_9CORY|nr:alpha/beta fold hydrolase [Corynebacterium deserti]ALC05065.1 aminopeptidase [Corynebacterium deserti GIMN1.010]